MEPILISFSIVVVGVMGAVLLFSVAMRGRGEEETPQAGERFHSPEGNFFLTEAAIPEGRGALASETILLQLERHFRLEEEAAAGFLDNPNVQALHAPSLSPLWD